MLLLAHNADPGTADARGMRPIHHAARSDYNVGNLQRLVQHGADINARDGAGSTPLQHARVLKLVRMPEAIMAAGGK